MLRSWRSFVAGLLALPMVACVTTESGVFTEKKDPQKALEYSVQAARSYISQRNWDAAKRHLRTAVEIDANNAEVHESLALVFQNTGEFELADQHFRRSVALDGKRSRVRNNYAVFLYQQARYSDAEKQLERVVEDVLYESRPAAYVNLGLVRMKLLKYDTARDAFERARLMDNRNPVTLFQLAEVHYQLGDFSRAQQFYEGYRKQVPRQTAGTLWLGVRLADKFGDRNAMASYALALKNLYPRSDEYLEYLSVYGNGATGQ
jgi:type IV pilus assembly protein PilF